MSGDITFRPDPTPAGNDITFKVVTSPGSEPVDTTGLAKLHEPNVFTAPQVQRLPLDTNAVTTFVSAEIQSPTDPDAGHPVMSMFAAKIELDPENLPGVALQMPAVAIDEWDTFAGAFSGRQALVSYGFVGVDETFAPVYRFALRRTDTDGDIMSSQFTQLFLADPIAPDDATTKRYVDATVTAKVTEAKDDLLSQLPPAGSSLTPNGTLLGQWAVVCAKVDDDGTRHRRYYTTPDVGAFNGPSVETRSRVVAISSKYGNYLEFLTQYRNLPEVWMGDQDNLEHALLRASDGSYGYFKEGCWIEDAAPVEAGEHAAARWATNAVYNDNVVYRDPNWRIYEGVPVETMVHTIRDDGPNHEYVDRLYERCEGPGFTYVSARDGSRWRRVLELRAPGPGSQYPSLADYQVGLNDGTLLVDYVRQWNGIDSNDLRLSFRASDAVHADGPIESSEVPGQVWTNQGTPYVVDLGLEAHRLGGSGLEARMAALEARAAGLLSPVELTSQALPLVPDPATGDVFIDGSAILYGYNAVGSEHIQIYVANPGPGKVARFLINIIVGSTTEFPLIQFPGRTTGAPSDGVSTSQVAAYQVVMIGGPIPDPDHPELPDGATTYYAQRISTDKL